MHQPIAPMDHTGLAQMQQNPNPTHNPYPNHNFDPLTSSSYPTNPTTGYPNPDPYNPAYYTCSADPHSAMLQPRPLEMDPLYVTPPVTSMVSYDQNPAACQSADAAAAGYYLDSNASWAAAYGQFGVIPQATVRDVTLPNATSQLHKNKTWKKAPKKTKIVQSAWCEVCKIDCNSKDVLDNHKLGKKHKKNLEKLRGPTNTTPVPANRSASVSTSSIGIPIIGPPENPNKAISSNAIKARKKKAATIEDLETKRKKVLDGGAAAEAVRTCTYCNVVCNSETVFNYHIAGQKHAAMVKKHSVFASIASVV